MGNFKTRKITKSLDHTQAWLNERALEFRAENEPVNDTRTRKLSSE